MSEEGWEGCTVSVGVEEWKFSIKATLFLFEVRKTGHFSCESSSKLMYTNGVQSLLVKEPGGRF